MTPEQIREAVELAEGWSWHDGKGKWCIWAPWNDSAYASMGENYESRHVIAALASQLISQVDAMGPDYSVREHPTETFVYSESGFNKVVGDNRDENSILACTEVLRGRK